MYKRLLCISLSLILLISSVALRGSVALAFPMVDIHNPTNTESNFDVSPNLSLQEDIVSDNVVHTIHWNNNIKGFNVEIYNRVTYRYKDVCSLSQNELNGIVTVSDMESVLNDLPWSYCTLDLAQITDNDCRSDDGEYSINFSSILQAQINSGGSDVCIAQVSPIVDGVSLISSLFAGTSLKNKTFGFDANESYNHLNDYLDNKMYVLQTVDYGSCEGSFIQYDRVEYFVRFTDMHSHELNINNVKPSDEDGRYHYTFNDKWVYQSNVPCMIFNGSYDISFSKPVAYYYEGGEDGYTLNHTNKVPLFKFNPSCLYKSSTKLYGDDLQIHDSNFLPTTDSWECQSNLDFSTHSSSQLFYDNIIINETLTDVYVDSAYINNLREPRLRGSYNISYDTYWGYSDGTFSNAGGTTTKDITFKNYFYTMTNPYESGCFANSDLPVFTNMEDLQAYFNGTTYSVLEELYTPVYPVLKAWNDDSKTVIDTTQNSSSTTVINESKDYITNVTNETINDDDDDIIKLLKKISNTLGSLGKQILGTNTLIQNLYDLLEKPIQNISGTLSNIDKTFTNIYNYLTANPWDSTDDDKADLTPLTNALGQVYAQMIERPWDSSDDDISGLEDDFDTLLSSVSGLNYDDTEQLSKLDTIIQGLDNLEFPTFNDVGIIDKLDDVAADIIDSIPNTLDVLSDIESAINDGVDDIVNAINGLDFQQNNFNYYHNEWNRIFNRNMSTKFPFCLVYAVKNLMYALVFDGKPLPPRLNIPNNLSYDVGGHSHNVDVSVDTNFNVFNSQHTNTSDGDVSVSFNDFMAILRLIILFAFTFYFGLFAFKLVSKIE